MLNLFLMFLFLLTVNNFLSSVKCDQNDFNSVSSDSARIHKRIVGGCKTEKYCNAVFHLGLNPGSCTGTFIAPNAILTAAHCCKNQLTYLTIDNNEKSLNVAVSMYHINPDFKNKSTQPNDDIAIIELRSNVDWVVPAKLDYSGVGCGEEVWLYGYGWIDENGKTKAQGNNELRANVISCAIGDWAKRLKYWFKYGNVILSFGADGTICGGDSGGPMFKQNGALVGLLSIFEIRDDATVECPIDQRIFHVQIGSHQKFIQSKLPLLVPNSANSSQIGLNQNLISLVFVASIIVCHTRIELLLKITDFDLIA